LVSLNESDAALVKGMLLRGDRQHDIASWFGVNGGRIAEVATGKRFGWVQPATGNLPPKGPYMSGRNAAEAVNALAAAFGALREAEKVLQRLKIAA